MLAHETARLSVGSSSVRLFFFHTFGIMSAQEDRVRVGLGQVTVWASLGHLDGLRGGPRGSFIQEMRGNTKFLFMEIGANQASGSFTCRTSCTQGRERGGS